MNKCDLCEGNLPETYKLMSYYICPSCCIKEIELTIEALLRYIENERIYYYKHDWNPVHYLCSLESVIRAIKKYKAQIAELEETKENGQNN